jgi:hypothetical protein
MLCQKVCKKSLSRLAIIFSVALTLLITTETKCLSADKKYTVTARSDGGYSLEIELQKRHWKPITAEGIFPVEKKNYSIEIIGTGEDWSYRNQKGYYYGCDMIKSSGKICDFGYAWVSADRKYLYLNLYWVTSPDRMTPSDVNGRYDLIQK